MTIKLIAIDMDETLLRSDKTYEEERFRKIFNELRSRDVTLAIASGNIYPRLDEYFSHMNHDELYFAADNGNYVVKKGEVLHKAIIDYSDTLEAAERLHQTGNFSVILCDGTYTYSKGINPEYADFISNFYSDIQFVDDYKEIQTKEFIKVANHSHLPLDEIKEYAEKVVNNYSSFDAVTSGGGWFDFYHVNGGKGTAVKALQNKYKVSPEETMVFGDSLNDASMFEHAKYSIAMSNADEALKQIANYEIGSNDDQSVLDILEELLETESAEFMEKYRR